MAEPEIAQKEPYAVELVEGKKYAWCTCGRSEKQPFCDGTHSDGDMAPVVFTAEKSGTAYLCGCKHTDGQPFCDGTHSDL